MEVDFGIFLLVVRGRRSLLLRRGFGLVLMLIRWRAGGPSFGVGFGSGISVTFSSLGPCFSGERGCTLRYSVIWIAFIVMLKDGEF